MVHPHRNGQHTNSKQGQMPKAPVTCTLLASTCNDPTIFILNLHHKRFTMTACLSILPAGDVPVLCVEHLGARGQCGQGRLPVLEPGHHLPPG